MHWLAFQRRQRNHPLAGWRQVDAPATVGHGEFAEEVQRQLIHASIVEATHGR
ncbi:hypothetical protein [Mycobacterium sp. IDR2000157661]|uniref:hypothetical protein n=1 Tax=Mycobacterium sp. IDR2000157661 TaxID=2867005 RepID=UPI001EEBDA0B|nr:hypothetical protein [Mycobacterium sp. IDR2000157661]ULE31801.1 hypothetical protein K3G64_16605 [Mycobacterium sp. IDR2000157661]